MDTKIYKPEDVKADFPGITIPNESILISPIHDVYGKGEELGYIVASANKIIYFEPKTSKFGTAVLTEQQHKIGVRHSFVFIATNVKYFSRFYTGAIPGKIMKTDQIVLDMGAKALVSDEFVRILKYYLLKESYHGSQVQKCLEGL